MKPEILALAIQAKAIEVDVEGMVAANQSAVLDGSYPYWSIDHFQGCAAELRKIADEIGELAE